MCDSRNRVNHVQSHLHAAVGMVCLGLGQSGHTVVTVPQNLYPPAVILLQTQRDDYLKQPTAVHQTDNVSHTNVFSWAIIKIHQTTPICVQFWYL